MNGDNHNGRAKIVELWCVVSESVCVDDYIVTWGPGKERRCISSLHSFLSAVVVFSILLRNSFLTASIYWTVVLVWDCITNPSVCRLQVPELYMYITSIVSVKILCTVSIISQETTTIQPLDFETPWPNLKVLPLNWLSKCRGRTIHFARYNV